MTGPDVSPGDGVQLHLLHSHFEPRFELTHLRTGPCLAPQPLTVAFRDLDVNLCRNRISESGEVEVRMI